MSRPADFMRSLLRGVVAIALLAAFLAALLLAWWIAAMALIGWMLYAAARRLFKGGERNEPAGGPPMVIEGEYRVEAEPLPGARHSEPDGAHRQGEGKP